MNIGVISASLAHSKKIIQLSASLDCLSNYTFHSFIYNDLEELTDILTKNSASMDGWLFSGPNPYFYAQQHFKTMANANYCNVSIHEIYKYLLEYVYEQGVIEKLRISIDYPLYYNKSIPYMASLNELKIPTEEIHIHEYTIPFDSAAITNFHLSLWQHQKTSIAITTLQSVYDELSRQNVPVKRIAAGTTAILQGLYILHQKLTGIYFKNMQVGLAIFRLTDYSSVVEKTGNSYKMQQLDLKLKSRLLDLSQSVNGYLYDKGDGYYEIFSSRGSLEDSFDELQHTLHDISVDLGIEIICGIGLGQTVAAAHSNSHRALSSQKDSPLAGLVIVDETGQITEYSDSYNKLTYSGVTETPQLTAKLTAANVSIITYNKILAITKKFHLSSFTAVQLAQHLNVTSRNIQRILAGLNKSGLIYCVGQETLNKRGRPTKKYILKTPSDISDETD